MIFINKYKFIDHKGRFSLIDESVWGYKLNTNFNELKTGLGRMFGFA